MSAPTTGLEKCANCGAELASRYCPECGQSREELKRPILGLVSDALDGALNWDGRFLVTLKTLFTRTGGLGRAYMEGERAKFTSPIRLYLIISLLFFLLMSALNFRVLAVQFPESLSAEAGQEATDSPVTVTVFRRGQPPEGMTLSDEEWRQATEEIHAQVKSEWGARMAIAALRDPASVERAAAAAAAQAMVLMLVAFALINLALHPRRKIVEHVVHSLYFHSAFLIGLGVAFAASVWLGRWPPTAIGLALISAMFFLYGLYAFDRGFYHSSRIGAALRVLPIAIAYSLAAVGASLGLLFVAAFQ